MPLLWVSLAFVLGLFAGRPLKLSWEAWLVLAVSFLSLTLLDPVLVKRVTFWGKVRNNLPLPIELMLLFFALGGLRIMATSHPVWQTDDLAFYNNKGEYLVTGWVSAAPDRRETMTVYQISVIEIEDRANPDWVHSAKKVTGLAQVHMTTDSSWEYGDLLQFHAKPLEPSFGNDFSYRDYLAQSHIHTVIYYPRQTLIVGEGYGSAFRNGLIRFREKARQTIFEIFPQPESGLLTGILLGVDSDLPSSLEDAYRDTGVAHIIAISGFNMAVLAGLFLWVFSRLFGPYWAALIASILLALYTLFVDASSSVWRALIMAVVGSGGQLIGRRNSGLNALFFTAALMCLVNPLLIGDVSFQLSFAATFGLVVFAQPMQDWLKNLLETRFSETTSVRFTKPLSEYFLFTLAAQFATLPVIATQFGRISLSSILANPLVLPVQPAVLVTGGLTTVAGIVHPLAGKVLMLISWPFLKYSNFMVEQLAKIQGGALTIHPSFSIWIWVVFVVFIALFFLREKLVRVFQSKSFIWVVLVLICACFSVISMVLHKPDGLLHIHLVRSGDEASLFLRTPRGQVWLIDPRGNMDELTSKLESKLSPWSFRVDTLLLTNKQGSKELANLADEITIREALLSPSSYRAENTERAFVIPDGIEITKLVPGETVEIEPGLVLTLLSENTQDTALLLQYGSQNYLIPNGVDFAEINAVIPGVMQNLSAVMLESDDISYIPPRVWRNLEPQFILWSERELSPFTNSLGADMEEEIHLVSDGVETWLVK